MNEEENIDDSSQIKDDSGEKSIVNSPSSMEEISSSETLTTYNLQPITPMEVHHHPHVEKKSFKEYLLEGLMIFIAVTMGFIAEQIREHFANKETEMRNIELVVENLRSDVKTLEASIKFNTQKSLTVDSMLLLRNAYLIDSNNVKKFYPLFVSIMSTDWFKSNNSGFEQMKSSGTIKLIKKENVLDSIYKYDEQNNSIQYNAAIDDELIHNKIEGITGSFLVYGDSKNAKVISSEVKPGILNRLFNYYFYLQKNLLLFYIPELQEQKQRAINLIKLLQTEYHLEHE